MITRVCKDCKVEKALEEFANAGVIKGVQYYRYRCKKCYSKFKMLRKNAIRRWYLEYRKTLRCKHCGNSDHRVIEHHHPNDDKFMVISDMVRGAFAIEKIQEEMAKCEALCANCHRIVTYDDGWYKNI